MSNDEAKQWYNDARPNYENLNALVRSTIESLLKKEGIEILSVSGRAKTTESFAEKIERKGYSNPAQQMTDLCGIRIITYIEDDVDKVCAIIEKSFKVHFDKSLNKSDELEVDRFGYRSVHFVCDLGKKRTGLPEYDLYEGMLFEVQVRTVLQHAWAEIEHDRSYKFSGALPSPLKRRLHLIAGMLELADREFNSIAQELETYSVEVSEKTKKGELDVELNTTSVIQYLKNFNVITRPFISVTNLTTVINELKEFGIHSLAELDKIITPTFLSSIKNSIEGISATKFLRYAMINSDMKRYFEKAWNHRWGTVPKDLENLIVEKHGREVFDQIVKKYHLQPDPT